MFKLVGQTKDLTIPACNIHWNPPGWGSGPVQVDQFQGQSAKLAMLVGIKSGGHIPFHKDNPAAENGLGDTKLTRFHLVLQSNSCCWNFHDGVWQQLIVGGIYQMDPSLEHASINLGETERLHLVVDV